MSLPLTAHIEKDGFRLRGLGVSRVDAFADVVFGFALTLLVVSLEVPKTYDELHLSLRGFVPFAISFYFLMTAWYAHYKYFRRFGTHDGATIFINGVLLFVVLFYVYPLKFLFSMISASLLDSNQHFFSSPGQLNELMMIYGFGFAAIYLSIAALYGNGLRQAAQLELTGLERLLTRGYMLQSAGVGAIGLLSSLVAWLLPPAYAGMAGWVYFLIAIYRPVVRAISARRVRHYLALHKLTDSPRSSSPLQQ